MKPAPPILECYVALLSRSQKSVPNRIGYTNVNVEPGVADARAAGEGELIDLQVTIAGTLRPKPQKASGAHKSADSP